MAAGRFALATSNVSKKCIDDPRDLDDPFLQEKHMPSYLNPGRSRYALPPSTSLSPSLRIAKIRHLIDHYGSECISEDEITTLLEKCESPVAYDGFEPSGRMHIAQGLMKKHFVNALTDCGFTYLFWIADWFAVLNLKLGGDLEKIQMVGRYMIEVWRALGMNMDRVRFLWASEEFSQHHTVYWARVLDISTKNTLKRIQRCGQIMGRSDSGLQASQIFYPCMQAADVFFLGVDVCQLGLDQRKVNMLAREYADASGLPKPAVLSHPMCPGLKRGQPKMSKSIPDTAIFMEDTPEEVKRKIDSAFCPPEVNDNPILSYFKLIVSDEVGEIRVGDATFKTYGELERAYLSICVHPRDLKDSLIGYINLFLEPVRQHFESSEELRSLRASIISLQ